MSMIRPRNAAVIVATAALSLLATPAPASGEDSTEAVTVVAKGLEGPRELQFESGKLYVTESDTGQISSVDTRSGAVTPVGEALGPNTAQGADLVSGRLAIVTGEEGEPPDATEPAPTPAPEPTSTPFSSVLVAKPGSAPTQLADLLKYELAKNPDGQRQFGPDPETGEEVPLDALSNPFYVLEQRGPGYVLVADGGANDVLSVSWRGKVSTFFVPPTVTTGECAGRENNDPEHAGCDAVPTGLAYGPGRTLYVSALTGEAAGEGRIYVLDSRTGKQKRVITGLSSPTGVAVSANGTVYVSELLHNAPEFGPEGPPPGFDPATVGRLVKIAPDGNRTYAAVTMPTGLAYHRNAVWASAWSIAGFVGIADAGQIVRVTDAAFT